MIDPALLARLRAIAGSHLEELAGAALAGEIPLTNTLVNRLIGARLAATSGPVSGVHVEALDDDTVSAQLSLRAKMIPAVTVVARIEEQPRLPHRPILAVRWSVPGMGPLGVLAGPALSFLKALPRGLRAEDDRILVDLAELLRAQGLEELLPYLASVQLHTRRGTFLLRFELRVH